VQQQQDHVVLEVNVPEDVVQALAAAQAQSARVFEMYRLQNRYRLRHDAPYRYAPASPPDELELAKDIATAKALQTELVDQPLDMLRAALAGVAATVIHGRSGGLAVPAESLRWAVSLLVECATRPHMGVFPTERAMFPDGADRKAALALPMRLFSSRWRKTSKPCRRHASRASRKRKPRCTSDTSPGMGRCPPPISPTSEIV
jgi:hypothetical protein